MQHVFQSKKAGKKDEEEMKKQLEKFEPQDKETKVLMKSVAQSKNIREKTEEELQKLLEKFESQQQESKTKTEKK